MIEFELPDERSRWPSATGSTSLLGSLVLPSERSKDFWSSRFPADGLSDVAPSSALAGPPDPNLLRASGDNVAVGETDYPPPKPSWQRAAEAIEAIMAQRAKGFPLDIAPPSRGPTVQEAQARQAAAIAAAVSAGGTAGAADGGLAGLAVRAAPALVAAGVAVTPAVAAALPFLLIPTNSQSGTIDLGDGLRARFVPGQGGASIERRVDKGVLGSGLGARWEKLPVATTIGAGPDGRQTVFVDHSQLEQAIGAGPAAALLTRADVAGAPRPSGVPLPIIMEIRIGSSTDAGITVSHREATTEEILKVCPAYAEYKRIALRAAENARAAGIPNGLAYGNRVDREAKAELTKMSEVKRLLRDRGIHELRPQIALLRGERQSYFTKGSSVLDVLEIHRRKTVCVYDFKTGNARFPDTTITRYAREAALYAQGIAMGYTHIYVVPVRVP